MATVDIHIHNVNIHLLRRQYNTLIELRSGTDAYKDQSTKATPAQKREHLDGLINLLEEMLIIAEGRRGDGTNLANIR